MIRRFFSFASLVIWSYETFMLSSPAPDMQCLFLRLGAIPQNSTSLSRTIESPISFVSSLSNVSESIWKRLNVVTGSCLLILSVGLPAFLTGIYGTEEEEEEEEEYKGKSKQQQTFWSLRGCLR